MIAAKQSKEAVPNDNNDKIDVEEYLPALNPRPEETPMKRMISINSHPEKEKKEGGKSNMLSGAV